MDPITVTVGKGVFNEDPAISIFEEKKAPVQTEIGRSEPFPHEEGHYAYLISSMSETKTKFVTAGALLSPHSSEKMLNKADVRIWEFDVDSKSIVLRGILPHDEKCPFAEKRPKINCLSFGGGDINILACASRGKIPKIRLFRISPSSQIFDDEWAVKHKWEHTIDLCLSEKIVSRGYRYTPKRQSTNTLLCFQNTHATQLAVSGLEYPNGVIWTYDLEKYTWSNNFGNFPDTSAMEFWKEKDLFMVTNKKRFGRTQAALSAVDIRSQKVVWRTNSAFVHDGYYDGVWGGRCRSRNPTMLSDLLIWKSFSQVLVMDDGGNVFSVDVRKNGTILWKKRNVISTKGVNPICRMKLMREYPAKDELRVLISNSFFLHVMTVGSDGFRKVGPMFKPSGMYPSDACVLRSKRTELDKDSLSSRDYQERVEWMLYQTTEMTEFVEKDCLTIKFVDKKKMFVWIFFFVELAVEGW